MKYEEFLKILLTYKKASEDLSELNDLGFDFFEGKYKLSDYFYTFLITIFSIHYNNEGLEWISWFIFESDYGTNTKIKAWDKNKTPIAYSYEKLYELLESEYKIS